MLPILTVQAVSPMLATSIMFQAVAMGVEGILVMAIQTRNSYVWLLKCIFRLDLIYFSMFFICW